MTASAGALVVPATGGWAASARFATVSFALTLGGAWLDAAGDASTWLASVAILVMMLRDRPADLRTIVAGTACGLFLACLLTGHAIGMSLAMTAATIVEIMVALVAIRTLRSRSAPLYDPRNLVLFFGAAGLFASGIGAGVGAGAGSLLGGAGFSDAAGSWFTVHAFAMIFFGPLALVFGSSDWRALLRDRRRYEIAPIAIATLAISLLVFHGARYPALFLILPVITVAIFRLRFVGAVVSILIVAAVATISTASGLGPIAATIADPAERMVFLQLFLMILVASEMPIAAILVEREATTQQLADSERHYRLLADHSNDMIVRIGLDGVRHFVSPASRAILNYAPDEMIGDGVAPIHPDDRGRVDEVYRRLLVGAVDPVCAYRQQRRDGSYVWLEATYRLVRDRRGRPAGYVAIVRDIGRRHAAEIESEAALARLQESHRLLSMAETLAGIGHWRLDMTGETLFWSDEVFRIHGRAIGDIPTLSEAVEAYHPDDRDEIARHVDLALTGGTPWMLRARLIRPDGEVRHVESSGQAERDANGRIAGVFGIFRDVTDDIAASAELIAARDAARASAEAKSAFLATMSHEIRTPMTGVLGMIELLRNEPPPEDRARFFASLEQSASLLMTVVDDVLDFSKIESGKLVIERVEFDLADLCRNTVDLFHPAALSKGLKLTLAATVSPDGRVQGDPTRLHQVLSNLVSNAIKFTACGEIAVRLAIQPAAVRRAVRIEVADTGIGMDESTAARVFDAFVQADPSTTRRFGGTGLGLTIARRLVDAMGGTIALSSGIGAGTCFSVDLVLDAVRAVPEPASPEPVARHHPQLSILLAEDSSINRTLVEALARRDGHGIHSVTDGRSAVELAGSERFDVILMDIHMPGMDGLAATRAIRRGFGPCAATPIIALTADAALDRRPAFGQAGMTGFLAKPIDPLLLRKALAGVAVRHRRDASPFVPRRLDGDVLDEAILARTAAAIGPDQARTVLAMMRSELAARPSLIATLIGAGRHDAILAEAHALRGAMAGSGAVGVARLARQIEQACLAGEPLDDLALSLLATADATRAALDARSGAAVLPPL